MKADFRYRDRDFPKAVFAEASVADAITYEFRVPRADYEAWVDWELIGESGSE